MKKNVYVGLTLYKENTDGYGGVKKLGNYYAVPFSLKPKDNFDEVIILPKHVFWDHLEDAR